MCYKSIRQRKEAVTTDLEERIKQVQAGQTASYEAIVEHFTPPLYRYCLRMINQAQETEDAVQDILIKAYESIGQYQQNVSFSAWLFAIAYRHCLNLLRRRKLQMKFSWLFHREVYESSAEQVYDNKILSPLQRMNTCN
ncbi:RNA polymerase sigma-70 factor (ECF subfamily) [Paenibacillus taihuensis]|uniref:RNA polymerase sigma-70 factor (ECF subfamily) n=1 Tax=Paenibacillus taihuensis TaxID=1156355 RepID=A0A3D9QXY4_9BACL|nr:RNA polymerase sigma-70 factor (ECF subfamily) [Paenibacillus taihuensis]